MWPHRKRPISLLEKRRKPARLCGLKGQNFARACGLCFIWVKFRGRAFGAPLARSARDVRTEATPEASPNKNKGGQLGGHGNSGSEGRGLARQ
ncbi:hypothetical protein GCM10009429_45690 [Dyella marensis]